MLRIGELIRANREELHYSQEELCFGICSVANLSKIENGTQIPTRATFEALMGRMGLSTGIYPSFLNDLDKKAFELKHDFNELYANERYDDAEQILVELESMPKLDNVYKQFIQGAKILIRQQRGLHPNDAVIELEGVISSFIKDFSPDKVRRSVLTKTEISVLNAYAIANHRAGNLDTATKILYELMTYIESKVYDKEGISVVYTKILYNLSKYVGMAGDDAEAVRLCEIGVKQCIRYNRHTFLSPLLFNRGYGLMNLGRVEEAHDCIRGSYYIDNVIGDAAQASLEITKFYAKEHGIELK
jgi:transcriptional regulator with XRE-family HTH domain